MKSITLYSTSKDYHIITTIVIGCSFMFDINEKLVTDTVATNMPDMKRF